jgi:hypothetical protein
MNTHECGGVSRAESLVLDEESLNAPFPTIAPLNPQSAIRNPKSEIPNRPPSDQNLAKSTTTSTPPTSSRQTHAPSIQTAKNPAALLLRNPSKTSHQAPATAPSATAAARPSASASAPWENGSGASPESAIKIPRRLLRIYGQISGKTPRAPSVGFSGSMTRFYVQTQPRSAHDQQFRPQPASTTITLLSVTRVHHGLSSFTVR